MVTGVGKSGLVARKIAATFSSIGLVSVYLNPLDALHGDLGIVGSEDVCILISNSGETKELLEIEAKIVKAEFSILKLLGAGGGGYFLTLFNGNSIEKSKSELEINGLNLIKVEICKEGCISSNF